MTVALIPRAVAYPEAPEGATVVWSPFPGFQYRALEAAADELLIGGAKGSGKSTLLLVKMLRQVDKPLYAGAFVRESFPELQRPLDEAHRIYGALATDRRPAWSGDKKRFTFPSRAFIQFGHVSTVKDLTWTQGGNWAEICYDEVGNQPNEKVIDTLIAEIRCPDPTVRRQFSGSANPGFAGHPWVMKRYIKPCGLQGERIAFHRVQLPDGSVETRSRQFVPGRVTDNPIYANDKSYMAALMLLPERMKRCLLDGDWNAATGMALDELEPNVHLIDPFTVPAHWPYISSFDWGYAHPAVFMWGRVSDDGRVFICDTISRRLLRDWDLAATYNALVPPEALHGVEAGHDCWQQVKARGENAPATAEYFLKCGIHLTHANIGRVEGYKNMLQYMAWRETDFLPQRQPMVQFFRTEGNVAAVEQMTAMVNNPNDPTDVLKVNADAESGDGGDDMYDCLRYLLASRPMKAESLSHLLRRSAWDPDVLKREAEKFRRPQSIPAHQRRDGVFLGG